MKKEFVRNPYNYDSDELSTETGLHCPEPTLTQQQFLEESDINYIAEQFMRTGEIKVLPDMPSGGDFSGIYSFQDAMNLIVHAKQEFAALPARIRSRFDNDPAKLIDFLDNINDDTRAEAIALGLIKETVDEPGTAEIPPRGTQNPTRTGGTPPSTDPAKPAQGTGPKSD